MRKTSTVKLVSMIIAFMLTLTVIAPAAFAKETGGENLNRSNSGKAYWKVGFSDVDDSLEWARMAIDKMNAKGIFTGYPGGFFKPRNNITHLEALVIALRNMGWEDEVDSLKLLPSNVKNLKVPWTKGYYYIALAVQKGLVKPGELIGFNPNAPVKRYEAAKYLVRALGKEDEAQAHMKDKLPFKDAGAIPRDAVGYVYVITDLGLMKGYPGNVFLPQAPITRAEMAVLVDKLDKVVEPEDKNQLVGVVEGVDVDNQTITIKNSYGEKTYETIENVPVYIGGKYGDLADISSGYKVELVLNDDGNVVFIQVLDEVQQPVTVSARGLVTEVDEDEETVSLFTYLDKDKGFVGVLEKSNVEGWHYELSTQKGNFVLTGNTKGLEEYVGKKIVVVGTLETGASIYMSGNLIDVEDFYPVVSDNVVTFKVDDNTEINIDGKTGELSDIQLGDLAEIKAQDNVATEIKVYSFRERIQNREIKEIRDGKLKGEVVSLALRSSWEITIKNDEGTYTLVLDKNVELKNIDKLSDIKAGMEVELRIKNNKVTQIKASD